MKQGGDDLEDDFVVDDLVALSDGEGGDPEGSLQSDNAEEASPDEVEDIQPAPNDRSAAEKKRKRREKLKQNKAKVPSPFCTQWLFFLTVIIRDGSLSRR